MDKQVGLLCTYAFYPGAGQICRDIIHFDNEN